jgi:hypothetical protein
MFTKTLITIMLTGSVVLAQEPDEGAGPPPLDLSANSVEDYRLQADTALPGFGTTMLAAPDGFDWIGGLPLGRLALAVGDVEPTVLSTNGPMTLGTDAAQSTMMKLDTDRGRVRYVNLDRQFDYDTSSHQAVEETIAQAAVESVMTVLNVPTGEFRNAIGQCDCDVATIVGEDYETTDISGLPFSSHEAERMVTAYRSVNGFPVFDSIFRASVANDGQVARLLARWPQFRLLPGLVMRDRQEVLDDIASGIMNREMGAELVSLEIQVGYLRGGGFHIPVAEVELIDRDSGTGFHVPLVDIAPDEDVDGVADAADNCPGIHNIAHLVPVDCNGDGDTTDPGEETGAQCDRDNDGVGDECDNCPDTPNPNQDDADGDGTGDACHETEGACCGSTIGDDSCERMTETLCSQAGGMYLGDGSDCVGDTNGDGLDEACACNCTGAASCVDTDNNNVIDDVCTYGECSTGPCPACDVITKTVPADISGPFGQCRPDTFCNIHDRNQALACFAGTTPCASINIDAGGAFGACAPDGFCNIHDANHALSCFAGTNSCVCGPMPEHGSAPAAGRTTLLVTGPRSVKPGTTFEARVLVNGTIAALQSYQLHVNATGGKAGQIELVEIRIDDAADYAFSGGESFHAVNVETHQALSGVDHAGVVVKDRSYLATFVYRTSKDSNGTFVIDVLHGGASSQTALISDFNKEIVVSSTEPLVIAVQGDKRRQ